MMRKVLPLLVLCVLLWAACGSPAPSGPTPIPTPGAAADVTNGERIYFTSVSGRNDQITYTGGPNFGGMMSGMFLTCASCHGPEGHGGLHYMYMQQMDAPNITYPALNSMPDLQGKGHPYEFSDFKQEVEQRLDLNGEPLETDMPRWRMSDADLQDLFAFLKTLQ
jgi:nitrous oxide reductase accessory protein NosL